MTQIIKQDGTMEGPGSVWVLDANGRAKINAHVLSARALDTQFPDALLHLPFDGGVPCETDYSVNLAGHKLQFPTVASGGIIGRPGKFGKAVQLAEGTTNLVTNPSFEVDTAGWTHYSMIYARSTEWAKFGSASVKITGEANDGYLRTNDLYTVPNGGTVTAQAWVNTQAGGSAFALRITTGSTSRAAVYASGIGEEWLTCSWTNDTGSDQAVRIQLYDRGVAAGQVAYFDGVQLEAKSYPTPFCYGDMGPGHAWTGTPHASTSTRTEARLQYPTAGSLPNGAQQGTVSLWAMVVGDTGVNQYAFAHWRGAGNERIYIYKTAAGVWQMGLGDGAGLVTSGIHPVPGKWQHLVATWDNGTAAFYIDGALIGSGSYTPFTAMDPVLHLGESASGTLPLNGYLDDLLILDRALTPTEVRRLYEAGQAGLGVLCPPQSWQPLVGAGAPSWGFPGMTYIDTTNNRWYVNVGGTWRYVGLT